jgi:hypothetical protein
VPALQEPRKKPASSHPRGSGQNTNQRRLLRLIWTSTRNLARQQQIRRGPRCDSIQPPLSVMTVAIIKDGHARIIIMRPETTLH